MISFNLTKYYIFLLKKFLKSFSQNKYSSRHKEKKALAWRELFSDQSFLLKKKSYAEKLGKASKML